jgi:hypothetical protein
VTYCHKCHELGTLKIGALVLVIQGFFRETGTSVSRRLAGVSGLSFTWWESQRDRLLMMVSGPVAFAWEFRQTEIIHVGENARKGFCLLVPPSEIGSGSDQHVGALPLANVDLLKDVRQFEVRRSGRADRTERVLITRPVRQRASGIGIATKLQQHDHGRGLAALRVLNLAAVQ